MRVLAVVGPSDAGKTSLIERLVPALADRGRVATVKSIHHDVEIDEGGADTHRHRAAGAETTVGMTPSVTFAVERVGKDDYPDDWLALQKVLCDLDRKGFDYVVVEGFTDTPIPKLVVGDDDLDTGGEVVWRIRDVGAIAVDELADTVDRLADWRQRDAPTG